MTKRAPASMGSEISICGNPESDDHEAADEPRGRGQNSQRIVHVLDTESWKQISSSKNLSKLHKNLASAALAQTTYALVCASMPFCMAHCSVSIGHIRVYNLVIYSVAGGSVLGGPATSHRRRSSNQLFHLD